MTEKELKKLWIGDPVRIIASGKEGNYAGISKKGKIRVRWQNKILLVPISNLEKRSDVVDLKQEVDDKLEDQNIQYSNSKISHVVKAKTNEIDLHIEKLASHLVNEANHVILTYQIKAFEEFLTHAVANKKYSILVIHGKGEGVLRNEIRSLANGDPRIRFILSKNGGGATEFILG